MDNDQGSVEAPPRADKGETVSFTIATAVGYEVETVKFNDTPISPLNGVYSFTMPDNDVTISVTFNQIYKVEDHIEQDGDTYTIKTAKGWEVFCDCVKSSAYYGFGNKTVKLGLDITDGVTVSAGIPGKPFLGTFDGDGHTLAVALNSTDEEWVAPFSFFNGSIKNLTQSRGLVNVIILIRLAIFAIIFIGEHGEIALIAALGDVMVFKGLEHGTARLVGVGAVGETAVFGEAEDLTEIGS